MKDELLTIQQAAKVLGVSTKTLRRWESKGFLKPQRTIGNQRRYSKNEITILFNTEKGKAKPPAYIQGRIPDNIAVIQPVQQPIQTTTSLEPEPEPLKTKIPGFLSRYVSGSVIATAAFLGLVLLMLNSQLIGNAFQSSMSFLTGPVRSKGQNQTADNQVLAATSETPAYQLQINVPGLFRKPVVFLKSVDIKKGLTVKDQAVLNGGIKTNNADVDAGTGKLTASNVLYSIVAGSNITISGNKQNPTISANAAGVTSLEGVSGAVSLNNGSGISLNGLQISNSGVLSIGGSTGAVSLTAGSGISVSGTTITNTDTGSAQNIFKTFTVGSTDITAGSNSDTLTFAAGSGITLTGDTTGKKITITNPSAPSGLSTNGILYATGSNTFTTVAASTSGYVLVSNGPNAPPSWVSNSSTSPSFSIITSGTNTQASMVVGTGASLNFSGSGTINASTLNGATFASPGSIGSTTAGSGAFSTLSASSLISANGGLNVASGHSLTLTGYNNTGGVLYANSGVVEESAAGSDGQVLTLSGGVPTWQTSSATNYWQSNVGVVAPSTITNDLAVGGSSTASALFQISGTTGNATTSGILTFGGSTAQVQSENGKTLTVGGSNTGNVVINSAGNIALTAQGANLLAIGNLTFNGLGNHIISASSGTLQLGTAQLTGNLDANSNNITNVGTINGLTITANTGVITGGTWNGTKVDANYGGTGQTGYAIGDLLYADSTTTLAKRNIGSQGQILTVSAGGLPVWSNAGGTINDWQENSGALSPYNIADDLLLGASATSSAKFAFVNNAGGVPTETIAGTGSNTMYITGNGTLATTNSQVLTIGTTTTGNISVGTDATARTVSIGNNTGASAVSLTAGSGGIALNGGVTISTLTSGLVKATSGALSIATAGTDYQVPLNFDNGITNNSNTIELGGTLNQATTISLSNNIFTLGNNTGTGNVVISPNAGGQAALIVNKQGNSDILTASASSVTEFTIAHNGNVSFTGGSGFLNTLSSSASATQTAYIPDLASVGGIDAFCFVALGNCAGSGGGITGSGTAGQIAYFNGSNKITSSGNFLWNNALTVSGANGGSAAAIINQENSGDIFTASASGTPVLTIAHDGTLTDTKYAGSANNNAVLYATTTGTLTETGVAGLNNQCLLSGASGPIWGSCDAGNTSWVEANGTIFEGNTSEDVLIGGVATASAKFGFINVNSGTPTASVSAVGSGTGLAIGGDGTLQSLNNGTLTFGGSTTGNIDFKPGGASSLYLASSGKVGIGTTSPDLYNGTLVLKSGNYGLTQTDGTISMSTWIGTARGLNGGFIGTDTSNDLGFYVGGTSHMALLANGNVNIGQDNAGNLNVNSATLQVRGTGVGASLFKVTDTTGADFDVFNIADEGITTFRTRTNSSNAFQLQDSSGTSLFTLGTTGTSPVATIAANTSFAGLVIDNKGLGDIFTASTGGVTKFTIRNDGTIYDSNYTGSNAIAFFNNGVLATQTTGILNQCLLSSGSTPIWGACDAGNTSWVQANGTIYPGNSTEDLLVGGVATTSAKFSVTGIDTNAPVASLSGATGGLYLSATGALATTNKQSLTLGDANTGNIVLNGLSGQNAVLLGGYNTGVLTETTTNNNGYCLMSSGSGNYVPAWGACPGSGTGASKWTTGSNNIIYPNNSSNIVYLGTTASSNVNSELYVTRTLSDGAIGKALAVFDQTENQDIIAASAAGQTRFVVTKGGNLEFTGGSGFLTILNSPSITANESISVPDTAGASDTLCLETIHNCVGTGGGVSESGTNNNGQIAYFTAGSNITSSTGFTWNNSLSVTGTNGSNAAAIIDQENSGNIFTASDSGVTKFTIANDGTISDIAYTGNNSVLYGAASTGVLTAVTTSTSGLCLLSGGSIGYTPSWGACDAGNTSWVQVNGTIYPGNSTEDLLIGGTATASAKFAFINVNSGTPTASVSGATGASYLTANGALATTNSNTLTLGSTDTGNIVFLPGTGKSVTINGLGTGVVQSNFGVLSASALDLAGANVTGILPIVEGGSPFSVTNGAITQRITNEDFLLGGAATSSARFAVLNINPGNTPVASLSAGTTGGLYLTADGTLGTTTNQTLTIGSTSTGNIAIGTGNSAVSLNLGSDATGDMYYRNANGTLSRIPFGSANQILAIKSGQPQWTNAGGTINYWQVNSNAISPFDVTDDLLLGGTATASAKFAFLNNAGGTPVASVSANSGNIATYLTGDGTLGTTNRQSLVLGNSAAYNTTGNILLNPNGTGKVGIGTTAPASTLDITGTLNVSGNATVGTLNGLTVTANGTNTLNIAAGKTLQANDSTTFDTNKITFGGTETLTMAAGKNVAFADAFSTTGSFPLTLTTTGSTTATLPSGTITLVDLATIQTLQNKTLDNTNSATLKSSNFTLEDTTDTSKSLNFNLSVITTGQTRTLTVPDASGTICLNTNNCGYALGTNYWQLNSGAISPFSNTADLLLGSTATNSAVFAFTGVDSTTPVASISAVSGNKNGLVFNASAATIQSLNMNTLTLGGATTGNVSLVSAGTTALTAVGGKVGIGVINPKNALDVNGGMVIGSGYAGTSTAPTNGLFVQGSLAVGTNGFSQAGTIQIGQNSDTTTFFSQDNYTSQAGGAPQFVGNDNWLNSSCWGIGPSSGANDTNNTIRLGITSYNGAGSNCTNTWKAAPISLLIGGGSPTFDSPALYDAAIDIEQNSFGNADLVVNNSGGAGDLITASSAGVPKFTIKSDGTLVSAAYTGNNAILYGTTGTGVLSAATTNSSGLCLISGGSIGYTPSWGACDAGNTSWVQANGTIYPGNSTEDLLVGGVATASAKFGFINVNSGTPTASISAISGNNALSLDANGNIGTTNAQILTLGSASTGDIAFRPGGQTAGSSLYLASNGNVGIGTTTPVAPLQINGSYGSNGALIVNQNNNGDLIDASASGVTKFQVTNTGGIIADAPGGSLKLYSQDLSGNYMDLYSDAGGKLDFYNGALVDVIGGSGQLGIQQNAPVNNMLDVNGGAAIGTYGANDTIAPKNGLIVSGDVGLGTSAVGNGALVVNQPNNAGNIFSASSSGTTEFVINNSGNVGIGTTTPTALLDVAGTASESGNLTFRGQGTAHQVNMLQNGSLGFYNSVGGDTGLGANPALFISSVGRIGVNTSNPQYLLDVNGGSNATVINVNGTAAPSIQWSNNGTDAFNLGIATGNSNWITGSVANDVALRTQGGRILFSTSASGATNDLTIASGDIGINTLAMGNDTLVVNQPNSSGDILSASQSGNTKFVITNTGNVGIGTTSPLATFDVRANSGTLPIASISGNTSFAGIVIDQSGTGDIFTASTGGVPKFTIKNDGTLVSSRYTTNNGILYTNGGGVFQQLLGGSAGTCLTGDMAWTSCALGTNLWQVNSGALSPSNSTYDLLLGGTSTASARFAFINNTGTSTTPVASISANSSNIATYLSGSGVLGTTNAQTLTLGSVSTGDIAFRPGGQTAGNSLYLASNGNVGIGTATPSAKLQVVGGDTSSTSAAFTVTDTLGNRDTLAQVKDDGEVGLGIANANFGNSSSGNYNSSGYWDGTDELLVAQSFVTTSGGIIKSMSTYINNVDSTNKSYQFGIYSDSSGSPNTLLATSNVGTMGADGWQTLPITYTLSPNTKYWLVYWSNTNNAATNGQNFISNYNGANYFAEQKELWQCSSGCGSSTNGMPNSFGTPTYGPSNSYETSIYASFANPISALSLNSSGNLDINGNAIFQPTVDSSTAFQINNSTGTQVFGVDTAVGRAEFNCGVMTTYTLGVCGNLGFDSNSGNAVLLTDTTGRHIFNIDSSVTNVGTFTFGNITNTAGWGVSGNLVLADGTTDNFGGTIKTTTLTASRTYTLPDASGTFCVSGSTCATSGTVGYFQRNNGALAPANITDDLLLGGTSTTSARFAFVNNIGSGIPTASISANSGNNATYLSGAGVLGTTNAQSLTLGSASTGDIVFQPGGKAVGDSLYLASNGNVGIGTATPAYPLSVNGQIQATGSNAELKLMAKDNSGNSYVLYSATGDLTFYTPSGPGIVGGFTSSGELGLGVNNTVPLAQLDVRGSSLGTGTLPVASISGNTSFAGLVVDNSGVGDIFAASSSGLKRFTIQNNGTVFIGPKVGVSTNGDLLDLYSNTSSFMAGFASNGALYLGTPSGGASDGQIHLYNHSNGNTVGLYSGVTTSSYNLTLPTGQGGAGQCLENSDGAGTLGWAGCAGTNYWQLNNGALSPFSNTADLLLGGTATNSADFAFTGVDSATPVASISAFTNSGNKNGISLDASGSTIQSLNKNTLTLGGSTTGGISFRPGGIAAVNSLYLAANGYMGLGTTNPGNPLQILTNDAGNYVADFENSNSTGEGVHVYVGNVATNEEAFQVQSYNGSLLNDLDVRANGSVGIETALQGNAALAVNQPNSSGDIFSASQSGNTKFVINNAGNVGIGTTTPATMLDLRLPGSGTGDILRLGNVNNSASGFLGVNPSGGMYFNSSGDLQFLEAGATKLDMNTSGYIGIGPANTSELATLDVRADSGTISVASISGATSFAGLVVDNSGSGDLFTASQSGATKFTITNAGNIIAPNYAGTNAVLYANSGTGLFSNVATGVANQCLLSGVSTPTWGLCDAGNTSWVQTNGTIYPGNVTEDLLLGGTSTASAKFAFINNIGSGTPTASISANSGNNATYLSGTGVLGTTNAQTLQLGSASTGNVSLVSGGTTALTAISNGKVGIGTTTPQYTLDIAGTTAAFNSGDSGSLSNWATSAFSLPTALSAGTSVEANGYIYSIGGNSLGGALSTVNYAALNANGSTGAWVQNANALPQQLYRISSVVANGYIYVFGGQNSGGTYLSTVYYAKLNSDGSTGAWMTDGNALPNPRAITAAVSANGYVYVLGGAQSSGVIEKTVYYAKLNPDGSTGPWITNTNNMPQVLQNERAAIANGYLYVQGGYNGTSVQSTVYYAYLNSNGSVGAFTTNTNSLPAIRAGGAAFVANGYLYWAGGDDGSTAHADVYYGKLNGDGSVGIYNSTSSLLTARTWTSGVSVNGYFYVLAGDPAGSSFSTTVYYTSTARVSMAASLDLIGLTGQSLASASANEGTAGSVGGSIYAGDIFSNGNLSIAGNSQFFNGATVTNGLTADNLFLNGGLNGISPVASIAANTSYAGLVVDNKGSGDLFTASSSGLTRFVVTQNGNVGIGTATPANALEVNGNVNILGSNALKIAGNTVLEMSGSTVTQVTNFASGGSVDLYADNFAFQPGGVTAFSIGNHGGAAFKTITSNVTNAFQLENLSGTAYFDGDSLNGLVGIGAVPSNDTLLGTLDLRANSATLPVASVSGATTNAAVIVDQSGSGDIFTASKSGATKFVINNAGNVGVGTSTPFAGAVGLSGLQIGTLGFGSNTQSLLIGGYNNANGYGGPQISGNWNGTGVWGLGIGNSAVNTYTLRLGSVSPNTSGLWSSGQDDIKLMIGGNTQNSTALGTLDLRADSATLPIASFSGSTNFAGLVVDNSGSGDLFTASNDGATKFVINNAGNVGIGTTTPNAPLYVAGAAIIGASGDSLYNANTSLLVTSVSDTNLLLDKQGVYTAGFGVNNNGFYTGIQSGGNLYFNYGDTSTSDFAGGGTTALFINGSNGSIGIGTNNTSPLATLDVRGSSGTTPVASVSGVTSKAALVVDNSGVGDIFTASKSGATKFTVKNSGTVIIGNTTNGIQFDPTATATCSGSSLFAVFCGTARPAKQIVLTAEYPGAVITASSSANTNGFMTADASPSASSNSYNFENYYQWDSTTTSGLQDYTVAVEVTLPKDFNSWVTSGNAITIDFNTGLTTSNSNALDVYIYKKGVSNTGIPVYFSMNNVSATAKTWQQITITKSQLEGTTTWNQPGDQAVIYLTMHARDNTANYVQVGDIKLNYLAGF